MKRPIPLLLLLSVPLAAPAGPPSQDAPHPGETTRALAPPAPLYPRDATQRVPLERALATLVDARRAAADVRDLVALGPRMGGTASGARASEHLRATFGELGLATRVIEDPPTWAHEQDPWSLAARALPLEEGGATEVLELARAWPYGFSPSLTGRFELSREPREGGAWLTGRAPRGRRAGQTTAALVLVAGHVTAGEGFPRIEHLPAADDNPFATFGLARDEGEWLEERLAAGRRIEIDVELVARNFRAQPLTVEARLAPRADTRPGFLLFCAHGDSDAGGPGANDNGSGEAILYEIARAWTHAIRIGALPRPPVEVRFAIWGKEIHSSRHYLKSVAELEGPCLGVLNYDQAGFGSSSEQLNVEPDDVPANRELVRTLAAVLADHAGVEGFPPRWATNKSLGGTDSYVFSSSFHFREHGIPALTLFTSAWDQPAQHPRTPDMPGESWSERDEVYVDYDVYYHSAGDLPELTTDLEPHNMAWCARVGWLAALRWLEP